MTDRIELERRLIGIIKRRSLLGIAVSVRFSDLITLDPEAVLGNAYLLCLLWCVAGVAAWVSKREYDGQIAYFFEAGHQMASRADEAMLHLATKRPDLRNEPRYSSHSFVGKDCSRPVQAADILAWQWYKDLADRFATKRRGRRLDLVSLLEAPHIASHLSQRHIHAMAFAYLQQVDSLRRFDWIDQ